ncbi:MAG: M20/M25/M40 family metallo-hydrolase [Lachnospiraceae bacterium]|nr:M20/M25/M40 family metallo-hydrolase [Lachnospiraceae bacterium]
MKGKNLIKFAATTAVLTPVAVALTKTLLSDRQESVYEPHGDEARVQSYAEKLSAMLQYDTTSYPGQEQREKFLGFHKLLEELFPQLHATLEKTEIDGNLFYYWKGKSSDKSLVLMSHQDVVPAEGEWLHGPFSGDIADGKVWGRGAADIKCGIMTFMQAIEELVSEGYTPDHDVYICSSCTEETGGDGGPKLVAELQRRGVRPWLLCDEGGAIVDEPMGGVKGSIAMIGVVEKGIANVRFIARSNGGHASSPSKGTPIARLAAFVHDVETNYPFRSEFLPQTEEMLNAMAPYSDFCLRLLLGNTWLFKPLLKKIMPVLSGEAAAMLRTTIAFTMQSGSEAFNVIPQEASVSANLRFIPHQGRADSLEILRKRAEKFGLEMEVITSSECCPVVDTTSSGFNHVVETIKTTFPGLAYSPYVMTGATDARFYGDVCETCIRFAPLLYGKEQMKGMHGLNENMSASCLTGAVDFYRNLITSNK